MRKLLVCYTRGGLCLSNQLLQEEVDRLSKEAHLLAEAAGDEYEQWRLHVADLFTQRFTRSQDADTRRKIGLEAAEYFQRIGDWIAFSEALDGYASISGVIGAYTDMLAASQRRLIVADLPATERKDALFMIVRAYIALNDFENCIKVVEEELAPGHSLYAGEELAYATYAAYLCGRWQKVKEFASPLAQMWERVQHDSTREVLDGYLALFHVAQAQEDEAAKNAAIGILRQIYPDEKQPDRLLLEALFQDDPKILEHISHDLCNICLWEMLLLYNEHGIPLPHLSFFEKDSLLLHGNSSQWFLEINRALAKEDTLRLEHAINEVEASHRVVHAARMRIILAQRSGETTQLERARLTLEQLGDRRSLRKLEEVRAALVNC